VRARPSTQPNLCLPNSTASAPRTVHDATVSGDGCTPHSVFTPLPAAELPGWWAASPYLDGVPLRPIQLHMVAVALFASLVGPFGGFLASAVKRAFEIKDFASFLPGHGGLMDRNDCQMLTALFVSVWARTFVISQ